MGWSIGARLRIGNGIPRKRKSQFRIPGRRRLTAARKLDSQKAEASVISNLYSTSNLPMALARHGSFAPTTRIRITYLNSLSKIKNYIVIWWITESEWL